MPHPQQPVRQRRAVATGELEGLKGLQVEGVAERQAVHLTGGGRGRVHNWPGEEEGRGSRDGRGRRRSGGQRTQRAGLWWSRRRSGRRGWLGEEEGGLVGCSILGWWKAGH